LLVNCAYLRGVMNAPTWPYIPAVEFSIQAALSHTSRSNTAMLAALGCSSILVNAALANTVAEPDTEAILGVGCGGLLYLCSRCRCSARFGSLLVACDDCR
jgi:hypothetical protein